MVPDVPGVSIPGDDGGIVKILRGGKRVKSV